MGEFFKLWRRRVGVVTLLLACGSMDLWIRSKKVLDLIRLPFIKSTTIYLLSDKKTICFGISSGAHWTSGVWQSKPAGRANDLGAERYFTWYENRLGFGIAGNDSWPNSLQREVDVPYWYVVIPLTLLSAWLLLSKPRQSKSKIPTEPKPQTAA